MFDLITPLALYASFFLAGLATYGAFSPAFREEQETTAIALMICLIAGPICASYLLSLALFFFPSATDAFYLSVVVLAPAILFFVLWRRSMSVGQRGLIQNLLFPWTFIAERGNKAALILMAGALGLLYIVVWIMPLSANDSLEYATASRLMYSERDLSLYPLIDTARTGGFYAPWTHPPGYVVMQVWGHLIQGGAEAVGVNKFIGMYFTACSSLIIYLQLKRTSVFAAWLGILLFLSTPLIFSQSINASIDPLRISTLLALFASVSLVKENAPFGSLVVGIFLMSALFTHSINILCLPLLGVYFLIADNFSVLRNLKRYVAIFTCGLLPMIPFYVQNVLNYGSPISDSPPLWQLVSLNYSEYFRYERNLYSTGERLIFGGFKGLSKVQQFGGSYWVLLIAGSVLLLRSGSKIKAYAVSAITEKFRQEPFLFAAIVVIIFFYLMVAVSMVLGLDMFIKNDRYILSVQPFVVLLAAAATASVLKKDSSK